MKILILSSDPVGRQMAGLGIRNYQIALELAKKMPTAEITLAVPNTPDLGQLPFKLAQSKNNLDKFKLIWQNELIISQGLGLVGLLFYPFKRKKFLLDLYDPINMEWLETGKNARGSVYSGRQKFNRDYLNLQLRIADFIVCANGRQKEMWLGMLSSQGRIDTKAYQDDPTLASLISLVPFGIRSEIAQQSKKVLKGVVEGIHEGDKVLLWNGGVWNWFDPKTAIQAVAKISERRQDVKLYFLGTKHPNPKVDESRILSEAVDLAKKLGVLDRFVFFNFGWVNFSEAKNYLLESDIGIATYFDNLETTFAHRTRFLDLFWARLPIICTKGDYLSEEIEVSGWGLTVPEKDTLALVEAIERLVDDQQLYQSCRVKLEETSKLYSWEKILLPIVNFCHNQKKFSSRNPFNLIYTLQLALFYLRWLSLKLFSFY